MNISAFYVHCELYELHHSEPASESFQ